MEGPDSPGSGRAWVRRKSGQKARLVTASYLRRVPGWPEGSWVFGYYRPCTDRGKGETAIQLRLNTSLNILHEFPRIIGDVLRQGAGLGLYFQPLRRWAGVRIFRKDVQEVEQAGVTAEG